MRSNSFSNADRADNISHAVRQATTDFTKHAEAIDSHVESLKEAMKILQQEIKDNKPKRGYTFPKAQVNVDDGVDGVSEVLKDLKAVTPAVEELIRIAEEYQKFYAVYIAKVDS